jgi:hypothetical protein
MKKINNIQFGVNLKEIFKKIIVKKKIIEL